MPVDLNSIPVTNTLNVRITLLLAGVIKATLDPGDAQTVELRFDQVGLYNPGHPPIIRNQNPPTGIEVHPGNLGYFETGTGPVTDFRYAQPGQAGNTVHFG